MQPTSINPVISRPNSAQAHPTNVSGHQSRQPSVDMNHIPLNPARASRQTSVQSQNNQPTQASQHHQNDEAIRNRNSLYRMSVFPTQPEGQYNSTPSRSYSDQFQPNISSHPLRPASVNSSSHDPIGFPRSQNNDSAVAGSSTMSDGYYRNLPSQNDMGMLPSRQAREESIRNEEEALRFSQSLYSMTGYSPKSSVRYDPNIYLPSVHYHSSTLNQNMGYGPSLHRTTTSTRYPTVPGTPTSSIYTPNDANSFLNEESFNQRP
jgi:hypothetical protein